MTTTLKRATAACLLTAALDAVLAPRLATAHVLPDTSGTPGTPMHPSPPPEAPPNLRHE